MSPWKISANQPQRRSDFVTWSKNVLNSIKYMNTSFVEHKIYRKNYIFVKLLCQYMLQFQLGIKHQEPWSSGSLDVNRGILFTELSTCINWLFLNPNLYTTYFKTSSEYNDDLIFQNEIMDRFCWKLFSESEYCI